jgi:hypothetical protein
MSGCGPPSGDRAAASDPAVPQQAFDEIELAFAKGFTLAVARPPDDHPEDTAVARRQADSFESGLELFPREMNEHAHYRSLIRTLNRSKRPIP